MIFGINTTRFVSNFTRLTAREITYNNFDSKYHRPRPQGKPGKSALGTRLKYHSRYLCQISLQIKLLRIQNPSPRFDRTIKLFNSFDRKRNSPRKFGASDSRLPFCFTHSLRVAALFPGRRKNSLPPFFLLRGDGRVRLHVGHFSHRCWTLIRRFLSMIVNRKWTFCILGRGRFCPNLRANRVKTLVTVEPLSRGHPQDQGKCPLNGILVVNNY